MKEVFDEKEHDRAQPQYDADLVLGPVMLLGIFFVLALICGGFFGWGYSVGHRGSQDESAVMKPAPDAPASAQAGCLQSKPAASSQMEAAPAETDADDSAAGLAANDSSQPGGAAGSTPGQPSVKPALNSAESPSQPSSGMAGGQKADSSILPAGALMVQIAAVSRSEDADALVSALRKRGYAVTANRETADNLIHVRIGPFTSRDEASQWRQKLTNDGYNAVVQQ